MGRPPLPIGAYGKIRVYRTPAGWRAITKYRDHDGITRTVERAGRSQAAAVRTLKAALSTRQGPDTGAVTADTRVRAVAEVWFASIRAAAAAGHRSPGTVDQYRGFLDRVVLPGLGELRLRECTVARVDAFLVAVREHRGVATAKTCRSVLSGVLGVAVRYGALAHNPVRDASRIHADRRHAPRALTATERTDLLARVTGDPVAVRHDLPDLIRFMLATGVRIGEALAVYWSEVDLAAGTVEVAHTVIRVKGVGLVRKSTKTAAGERTLALPSWAVTMLAARDADPFRLPGDGPVFPDSLGGLRDPSNTMRTLRAARDRAGYPWITSHVFRKTAATILDEAGLSAREVADQLGHARPSMTQDVYLGRRASGTRAAAALEGAVTASTGIVREKRGNADTATG